MEQQIAEDDKLDEAGLRFFQEQLTVGFREANVARRKQGQSGDAEDKMREEAAEELAIIEARLQEQAQTLMQKMAQRRVATLAPDAPSATSSALETQPPLLAIVVVVAPVVPGLNNDMDQDMQANPGVLTAIKAEQFLKDEERFRIQQLEQASAVAAGTGSPRV